MKKSKFDFSIFEGGDGDSFVFNKANYTKEQAVELAKSELQDIDDLKDEDFYIEEGFIAHRFFKDIDDECINAWVYDDEFKQGRGMLAVWIVRY